MCIYRTVSLNQSIIYIIYIHVENYIRMFRNKQSPLPSLYAVPGQDPRKSWIIGGWGDFIHWASFVVFVLDPRLVSIN